MKNIIDRYGIKEVADVVFYEITDDGEIGAPVLFLDTLKVSTIEQTAEETSYYGGKGNSLLSSWQSKKELTLTLQDALFSMKSLAMMLGGSLNEKKQTIKKTEIFVATSTELPNENGGSGWDSVFKDERNNTYKKNNPKFYNQLGQLVTKLVVNEKFLCTFELEISSTTISISPSFLSKNYCVFGETYIRSEVTGRDEAFYFIIPKAQFLSNVNIELSGEDPSVFDMTLKVLRFNKNSLIELIKINNLIEEAEDRATLGKAVLGQLLLGKK